jgi:hypothetical protein
MDLRLRLLVLLGVSIFAGCARDKIPNTEVDATSENEEIVAFMEDYRKAVEARDTSKLIAMASRDYFDDMGTPAGDDDVDYDRLVVGLKRLRAEVRDARYQIRYRSMTYARDDRVLVDMLYTGWFKVETPDGPQWRRRLEPHRVVVARETGGFRIVSGM